MVALDDGSVDGSAEFVAAQPAVLELLRRPRREPHEWHDGDNHRRLAEAATRLGADWLLGVDADERLEQGFGARTRALVRRRGGPTAFHVHVRELWDAPDRDARRRGLGRQALGAAVRGAPRRALRLPAAARALGAARPPARRRLPAGRSLSLPSAHDPRRGSRRAPRQVPATGSRAPLPGDRLRVPHRRCGPRARPASGRARLPAAASRHEPARHPSPATTRPARGRSWRSWCCRWARRRSCRRRWRRWSGNGRGRRWWWSIPAGVTPSPGWRATASWSRWSSGASCSRPARRATPESAATRARFVAFLAADNRAEPGLGGGAAGRPPRRRAGGGERDGQPFSPQPRRARRSPLAARAALAGRARRAGARLRRLVRASAARAPRRVPSRSGARRGLRAARAPGAGGAAALGAAGAHREPVSALARGVGRRPLATRRPRRRGQCRARRATASDRDRAQCGGADARLGRALVAGRASRRAALADRFVEPAAVRDARVRRRGAGRRRREVVPPSRAAQ